MFYLLIVENRAGQDTGGGIYITSSDVAIYYSEIRDNKADERGGGISAHGGSLSICGSLIAQNDFAGIFASALCSLEIMTTDIMNNMTTGICIYSTDIASISNCRIKFNSGNGAAYRA